MQNIKRERCYETMFIIKQSLSKEEIQNKITIIKDNIEKNNGVIVSEVDMGMRTLAYPINKDNKGYYYLIYFKIDSKNIEELNRLNRIDEDLIRFIFIKYETKGEIEHWNTRSEMAKKGQIEIKPPKKEQKKEVSKPYANKGESKDAQPEQAQEVK